jgi:hypothetical protein
MNNDGFGQRGRSIEVMVPGNSGVQGTSAIASELVVMAAQVLGHPESTLLRTALAHAAGEVIRTQGDLPVLQAIELAPDLAVARAIRAAAEAACEAVLVSNEGKERRARLFSVPVVVRFAEPTTTQEFDETLTSASWSAPFLARVHECGARHSITCILPHVFLFEDLANLSFDSVRRGVMMAGATGARGNAGTIMPFPVATPAQRRSRTFLRYLVGYQVNGDQTPDRTTEDRSRFSDCVRSVMLASMPEAQDVVAIYTGRFYDPIWQGLWIYHTHRLAEVVRIIAQRKVTPSRISASITVAGSRNQMEAKLAFFCRGRAARHHAYSVPIRPLDDPKINAQRIAAELRALGVTRYVGTPTPEFHGSERWSTCCGRAARRRLARNELTLPL